MSKIEKFFIKNIILWGTLLLLCNGYTVITHIFLISRASATKTPHYLGFVLGFFLQFPLMISLITFHSVIDYIIKLLSGKAEVFINAFVAAYLFFLALAFYFGAEKTYTKLNVYLPFDTFFILFTDTKYIFLNAWHNSAGKIIFVLCLSILFAGGYGVMSKILLKIKNRRLFVLLGIAGIVLGIPFIILGLGNSQIASSGKYHSFPTSYASITLFQSWLKSNKEVKHLRQHLDPIISLEEYAKQNIPIKKKPNVFIILLESISSDHVGFNGYYRRDITPYLDELSKDSLVFINAYAASNLSNYAQTSIHSSQYPRRRNNLDFFSKINYPKILLFDILSVYGYETAFISSQDENWQGMKKFILTNSHIDFFFHAPDGLNEDNKIQSVKLTDAYTRQTAEKYILEREGSKPLMLYLNFQCTHYAYNLPKGAKEYYSPSKIDFEFSFFYYPQNKIEIILNHYDNALRYVDLQVGLFVEFLKKNNLYDNSIIVVAPDHGEAFYQKGHPTHGTSLFDDQVKTFVLFKDVKSQIKGRREDAISLIDINPSILEMLELKNHPNFQGKSVIKSIYDNRYLFITAQGLIPIDGVISYPWKLIHNTREGEMLLNMAVDPSESFDLSNEYPKKRKELEEALNYYLSAQIQYYNQLARNYYPPKY